MNSIEGTVSEIVTEQGMSLVIAMAGKVIFTSIVLETPLTMPYLEKERHIKIMFNETEVAISLSKPKDISIRNCIPCIIRDIEKGRLLCRLILDSEIGRIGSVITTRSCDGLNLAKDRHVYAMIKTTEVMIGE